MAYPVAGRFTTIRSWRRTYRSRSARTRRRDMLRYARRLFGTGDHGGECRMDAIGTAEVPGLSSNSAYRTTAETDRIQTSPVAVEIAAPETRAFRGAAIVPSERRLRPRRADLVTEWPHVSVIIPTPVSYTHLRAHE